MEILLKEFNYINETPEGSKIDHYFEKLKNPKDPNTHSIFDLEQNAQ